MLLYGGFGVLLSLIVPVGVILIVIKLNRLSEQLEEVTSLLRAGLNNRHYQDGIIQQSMNAHMETDKK